MSAPVTLTSVEKSFGATKVVRGVSLRIEPGEFFSLLGPSGCGKTTLLRMIAGLERPDAGEIHIGDQRVAGPGHFVPPEQRGLAMVFQSYAVFPHRSVEANVAYPLELQRVPSVERATRVAKVLSLLRLDGLGKRAPHELSGGQLQRVALARALVAEPKVLLLDEPLSNLDAALREELQAELSALKTRLGLTTLFVTHDQKEALALSDRLAVLRDGVIEQVGTPQEIYERPRYAFVAGFVGGANVIRGDVRSGRFHTGAVSFECALPDGPAELGVRAEELREDPAGTELEVLTRHYQGGTEELHLSLGDGQKLRMRRPPAPPTPTVRVKLQRILQFEGPAN